MTHISTYLRRLEFDPKLSNSIIAKYLINLRLIILIVIAIIGFGAISFLGLQRNLFPDVKIPQVIVTTVIPGANPADMESLVTVPIEDAARGLSDVKKITSSSSDSVSSVAVEFETSIDIDKAKSDLQNAVDSVKLPEDALDPNVTKIDLQKTPIWTFIITGNADKESLLRFAKRLKKDLVDLPNIDDVSVEGLDDKEIQIVVKPEAISTFGVTPQVLIGSIKTALSTFPAGSVKTENSTFSLTINPQIQNLEDIRSLRSNLNGQIVSIGDIADVVEISKPDQYPNYVGIKNDGVKPSVTFNVFRITSVNIGTAAEEARELINQKLSEQNGKFQVLSVADYAEQIDEQFSDLQRDLIATIILVAIVLFIFLGGRQSFVALLATPLTFLITFIVMGLTGITLNFLSVFALLLSLGLLVDDTIVIVSAISAYDRTRKFTPLQTGILVWRDFIVAILTTTTTTIWAFLPILISTGIIGEFIKPIPIVVSTSLAASFFVAMFITMPFMLFLLRPIFPRRMVILMRIILAVIFIAFLYSAFPKNGILVLQIAIFLVFIAVAYFVRADLLLLLRKRFNYSKYSTRINIRKYLDHGVLSFQQVELNYKNAILNILNSQTLRRRIIIMVVALSIFSYLLVPFGFVKNEFFPKEDSDTLMVNVELPAGTNLDSSKKEALKIIEILKETPDTKYVTVGFGSGAFAFFGGGPSSQNAFNYTLVFEKNRKMNSGEIANYLREKFKNYTKGNLSVAEATGGPPAGADLEIKLFGPDLATLNTYADKIKSHLEKEPSTTSVSKSIKSGTSKIVFVPDEQSIVSRGLSTDITGFWLRLFATGVKVDTLKLDRDSDVSTDIILRMKKDTPNVQDISAVAIPTQNGIVPIGALGDFLLEPNPTLITREDGKRTISITAGVKSGYTIPQVNSELENYVSNNLDLPQGYSWKTGGVNAENQSSVTAIFKAMLISILLIVLTMVLQFGSFRRAIIIILVIPLAVSGVFIIFGITQIPLTFPALIGVLALFGIVVKNSILIMDRILANIKSGMEFTQSIADASASRLEPIALTSICAIVGLIPITLSDPLWRGLGGAIIAGLTFSGTIMLFFIPVVYFIVFNPKKIKK